MAYGDFAIGGMNMAQAMAGQQGGHLAGMANQAMGAIAQENASRVAQSRERARMQHDMNMQNARLSQGQEIARLTAIIERLKENCGEAEMSFGDKMTRNNLLFRTGRK